MTSNPILTLGDVQLEYCYFYELMIVDDVLLAGEHVNENWIRSFGPKPGQYRSVYGEIFETEGLKSPVLCQKDPTHWASSESRIPLFDITQGDDMSPFLLSTDRCLANSDLARQITSSDLKGCELWPIPVITLMGSKPKGRRFIAKHGKIYQMIFQKSFFWKRAAIVPATANACPHCGHSPLVCPDCGASKSKCLGCGVRWLTSKSEVKGSDHRTIVNELPQVPVVDPLLSDGSDFFGGSHGGWVTGRAINFLLSIHAYPFLAKPIPVDVSKADRATRTKLEAIKLANA